MMNADDDPLFGQIANGSQHMAPLGLDQLLGLPEEQSHRDEFAQMFAQPLHQQQPQQLQQQQPQQQQQQQQDNPGYYKNLSMSVMNLPVHDSASQLLRPPDFFGLGGGADSPLVHQGAAGNGKSASAGPNPWSGLFESGPANPNSPKKSDWTLDLPSFAVQPVAPVAADPQAQPPIATIDVEVRAPEQQQQQPQPQQQQQQKQKQQLLPSPAPRQEREEEQGEERRPAQGRKRNGRPELQRAKRKALTDLFLMLKQASYGDAMGRDPVVTSAIGRGKRSVNSKEAILRKASRDITELQERAASLEAEIAALESDGEAPSLGGPLTPPPSAHSPNSARGSVSTGSATSRGEFFADIYADGAAARFLTTPHGRLVSYSGEVASALRTPEEALVMASRGELSSYALIPSPLRSEYYAVLPVVLADSGPSRVEVRAPGAGGHLIIMRCGTGRDVTLDHLWVPASA